MKTKKEILERAIKEILKPFVYQKYGKAYIGYKETEGALRVEGLVLQLNKILSQALTDTIEAVSLEKKFHPLGLQDDAFYHLSKGYDSAVDDLEDKKKEFNRNL